MTGTARKRPNGFADERGTSVVEMLTAVILLFLLLMGVLYMFEFGLRNAKGIQTKSILSVEASNTMEKMVRQVRCAKLASTEADYLAGKSGFMVPTVVSPMTGNPIYFLADVRGDSVDRFIMFYRTSGNDLYIRESIGGVNPVDRRLARNVTGLAFDYYDVDGTSLGSSITSSNRLSIYRTDITLTMQKSTGGDSTPTTVVQRGTVVVRGTLIW